MVKGVKDKGKPLYICEACGFPYEEKAWADKCQEWCQEHQSCNIEITAHAVPIEPEADL
jgi:hypothetical protein